MRDGGGAWSCEWEAQSQEGPQGYVSIVGSKWALATFQEKPEGRGKGGREAGRKGSSPQVGAPGRL